jgi:hypothetical protein
MKVTSLGYDPDLGRKFLEEYNGSVIMRGRSSLEASPSEEPEEEYNQYEDLQQQANQHAENRAVARALAAKAAQQKALPTSEPSEPETEADGLRAGALRVARFRHQNAQLKKQSS